MTENKADIANISSNQQYADTTHGPLLPAYLFLTVTPDTIPITSNSVSRNCDMPSSHLEVLLPRQINETHRSVPITSIGSIGPYERVIVGSSAVHDYVIGAPGSSDHPTPLVSVGSSCAGYHRSSVSDSSYDELFSKAFEPFLPKVLSSDIDTDNYINHRDSAPYVENSDRGHICTNEQDILFVFVPSGKEYQSHDKSSSKETRSEDIHTFLQMVLRCAGSLLGSWTYQTHTVSSSNHSVKSLGGEEGVRTMARMSIIQYNFQLETIYDLLSDEMTEEKVKNQNEDSEDVHSRVSWLPLSFSPVENTSSSNDNYSDFNSQHNSMELLKELFFSYEEIAKRPHDNNGVEGRCGAISTVDRQGVIGKLLRLSSAGDATVITIEEYVQPNGKPVASGGINTCEHMSRRLQFLFSPASIHVPPYQDMSRYPSTRVPSCSTAQFSTPYGAYYTRAPATLSKFMQRVVSRHQQERNTLKEFLCGCVVLTVGPPGTGSDMSNRNRMDNGVSGDRCLYCSCVLRNSGDKHIYYRERSVLLDCLLVSRRKRNEELDKGRFKIFSTCKYCSPQSTNSNGDTFVNRATSWSPKRVVLIGLSHSSVVLGSHQRHDLLKLNVPNDDVFEFISDINGTVNSQCHSYSEKVLCCCSYIPDMLLNVKPFPTNALVIGRKEIPHYLQSNYKSSNFPREVDILSSSTSSSSSADPVKSHNKYDDSFLSCQMPNNLATSTHITESSLVQSSQCNDLKAIDEVRQKRRLWRQQDDTLRTPQLMKLGHFGEKKSIMSALGRVLEVAYELADRLDNPVPNKSSSIDEHHQKRRGTEELVAPFRSLLEQLISLQTTNQRLFYEGCVFSDLYRLENSSSALLMKQVDATRSQQIAFIYYNKWRQWSFLKH